MGRGFGRGAKSVAIVTHAQAKGASKLPRGLRGTRQKKRKRFARKTDDQSQLEESLGAKRSSTSEPKTQPGQLDELTLAQKIAAVQFPTMVNRRVKGFKALRKQLLESVKRVQKKHAQQMAKKRVRERDMLAAQHDQEVAHSRHRVSGNTRRTNKEK